jgi:hypothetical protein
LPFTRPAFRRLAYLGRALLLCLGVAALPLHAADDASVARRLDAVSQVVLGILSYARWPREQSPLNLCLVGPTEYADGLLRLEQPPGDGQRIQVQRRAADDAGLGEQCQAVYLGVLSDSERQRVFAGLSGHAVLSIDEQDRQCSVGSMFCLDIRADQVSFAVNLDSVARSGVRVHPRVLDLARRRGGA